MDNYFLNATSRPKWMMLMMVKMMMMAIMMMMMMMMMRKQSHLCKQSVRGGHCFFVHSTVSVSSWWSWWWWWWRSCWKRGWWRLSQNKISWPLGRVFFISESQISSYSQFASLPWVRTCASSWIWCALHLLQRSLTVFSTLFQHLSELSGSATKVCLEALLGFILFWKLVMSTRGEREIGFAFLHPAHHHHHHHHPHRRHHPPQFIIIIWVGLKELFFLGIFPKPVDPPSPLGLGIKMTLLAKKVRFSRPKTMATEISHKVRNTGPPPSLI